jgi:RNA polymerase sigma factor (sigma-70 family)
VTGTPLDEDDVGKEARGDEAPGLRAVTTFEALYRASYPRMKRVAFVMTGSNEVAEDVVQDAFLQLYRRFDELDDPVPYLYRSVVNGCGQRRRQRRVVERLQHLTVQSDVSPFEVDETWAALKRLPGRRRAVVVLRFYADLPLAEIAQVLGCKTGTVKSMLHRALSELKEVVQP